MSNSNDLNIINDITKDFFNKINLEIENIDITKDLENIYYIKIESNDSPLLIGYSGKNLEDIRNILKAIFNKTLEKNIILHIEVNDYLSKKDEKLFLFIAKKIKEVKLGKDVILPFFNSYDRKKIHGYISNLNDSNIYTKSIGEGPERRLHICKKKQSLTIDLYGTDI